MVMKGRLTPATEEAIATWGTNYHIYQQLDGEGLNPRSQQEGFSYTTAIPRPDNSLGNKEITIEQDATFGLEWELSPTS